MTQRITHYAGHVALTAALAVASAGLSACSEPASAGAQKSPSELRGKDNPFGEEADTSKGLVVLGVDGMDYQLTRRYMREGMLPNFSKLAERGDFKRLATVIPPQSPVAWSTFITGLTPHGHGIYDFVHRDPEGVTPYLSTSKAEDPDCTISLGSLQIPYCSAEVVSLRKGVSFWEMLEAKKIPATIYKVPANFPPDQAWHTHTVSGMGTPDLMGTYGTFQVLTTDKELSGKTFSGGLAQRLTNDGDDRATGIIEGPPNPYKVGNPPMELPIEIIIDRDREVALARLSGEEVMLQKGEISEWVPIAFEAPLFFGSVPGILRLYMTKTEPLTVYVSPINLDPMDPAMPISSPAEFSAELAKDAGRYYTQGMPEDTKALSAEVLSDEEFLVQAEAILEERMRLLDRALDAYDGGMMFFYFSSLDQTSHVFWRALDVDKDHPLADHADVIPNVYKRMDDAIGKVLERVPEGTEVLVVSDHGFAPFDYKVNLNTWLYQKGYLALREDGSRGAGPLGHIDWSRTQAYALGLNQLFINLKGREPEGVVEPAEREALLRRLKRDLEGMRDPTTGRGVIRRVFGVDASAHPERSPDLIVGYDRGYRSSDGSAMGEVGDEVITPNKGKWSGDHCMDPAGVPGVIFSTTKLGEMDAGLVDMAPTILDYFDMDLPEGLAGKSIWPREQGNATDKAQAD